MNKSLKWVMMFLVTVVACGKSQSSSSRQFDGEVAMRYVNEHMAFGTRVPGTKGWKGAGDWIVSKMRERADSVIEQRWVHKLANGDSIPMLNVLARFNMKASDRILYVTHWDTRPIADSETDSAKRKLPIPGANDGASGVALFVALGDILKKHPPSVGVDLLFVDGEDYGSFNTDTDVLIGSRYFAANLPSPNYRPIFGVLWDMIAGKNLKIYQEQNSLSRAPEVVARVWKVAEEAGYSDVFIPEPKYAVMDDHIPLLNAGIRIIDVIDLDYADHHKLSDTPDKLSAKSFEIVGTVARKLLYPQ